MIAAILFAAAADLARGRVNLGRMQAITFQLQYRLATKQSLDIGATPHARAVALQLRDDELVDPWGTPYRIDIKGNDFLVIGAGSDRTFHPEEWSVTGGTYTLEGDLVFGPGLPLRSNAGYVNRGANDHGYGLYEVPAFVPLDQRDGMAPRRYEAMWEQAGIVLRYGELEALRATRTLAAMQLLASRLDAYRAKHGTVTNDLAVLRREPWPYNDWLESTDAWGVPLRIDVEGGSYRIRSAGSDPQFEQVIADGAIVKQFDRIAWTKRETARRDADDRAMMTRRSGEATTAPDGSPAYRIGGDVKAPVKLSGPEPQYPASLLERKIGGLIIVEMVVDEEGRVATANVLHSPNPLLSEAVVAALKQWKFQPGTLNGKPVKVILSYTVVMRPRT